MSSIGNYYGVGNFSDMSDPYNQGYYNSNPPFVGTNKVEMEKQPEADKFVSSKQKDNTEKILLLGVLGIAIGAYILKGKASIANLFKVKK